MNRTSFDQEDIFFSGHAEDRARERGFTASGVAELLSIPHETFPGDPHLGPDRWVHQFDDVKVVTGLPYTDGSVDVITVMLRWDDTPLAASERSAA